jgi:cytochrome c oxidase subunit 3
VLLLSSWTLGKARQQLGHNLQPEAHNLFRWTAILGFGFLCGQIVAWRQVLSSGVLTGHDAHPWFLFLFTGLHGLHILLGLAGIIYLYLRTGTVVSGPKYLMKTRVLTTGISIFWHYLDGLWIVLFGLLLFWRA